MSNLPVRRRNQPQSQGAIAQRFLPNSRGIARSAMLDDLANGSRTVISFLLITAVLAFAAAHLTYGSAF